jgi:hypothetical protein
MARIIPLLIRGSFTLVLTTCNINEHNKHCVRQVAGLAGWHAGALVACSCHSLPQHIIQSHYNQLTNNLASAEGPAQVPQARSHGAPPALQGQVPQPGKFI